MYEIKIKTKTLEEALEILKVIVREESEGSLMNFDFTACSLIETGDIPYSVWRDSSANIADV